MDKKNILIVVVVAIVAAGAAFLGGTKYAESSRGSQNNRLNTGRTASNSVNGTNRRPGATGGFGTNGNAATGEIISRDATSISIKLRDGGSKIIFYSSSTPVTKTIRGTAADLAVGEPVMILGGANQDGSISAQSIQLRPAFSSSTRP